MFEIGDKVVCVLDYKGELAPSIYKNDIFIYKKTWESNDGSLHISIKEKSYTYPIENFITLQEHRRNKILKIKKRINNVVRIV
jgi:hypothetical protein